MKQLIKKAISVTGFGVYRLNAETKQPPKPVVKSPLHHNSKEGLNEFYSDKELVESYLDMQFYQRLIALLAERGVVYKSKRVADVGCGTGNLLKFILPYDPLTLTGFEYSENALAIARSQLPEIDFQYLDVYNPPAAHFDVIFCIEVLEHLLYPDTAFHNIVEMLAPNGVALFTVPNGRIDTFEGHINFWSPESWKVFLEHNCAVCDIDTGLLEEGAHNFAVLSKKAVTC
ncbi:MAG TPA: class I SAM-dependent methyltransferase [Pyrinomonadaceae bacterium]|nr:class I SAM-dependent methyltransferase [Pyrinomonadaceae bacterium]